MDDRIGAVITTTITSGAILALVSVGFVVVYRATKVVSFAQGAFTLVGAFVFLRCAEHGFGFAGALAVALVVDLILGAVIYRVVFARMEGSEPFIAAVATIGLAIVVESVATIVWGSSPIILPDVVSGRRFTPVSGLRFEAADLVVAGMALVVYLILALSLQRTRAGLRMRAVADMPKLAAHSGVNVTRMSMLAWAAAAGTAAVAGVAFLLTTQPAPTSVYALGLTAFPAILLGGFDSIGGAVVGGFGLALVQAVVVTQAGGDWQDIASYGLLLAVLAVRPQGLFGSAEASRV